MSTVRLLIETKARLLVKVVPQNTSWILEDSNESGNYSLVILDYRFWTTFRNAEQLPEFYKARKTPILLLVGKAMVCLLRNPKSAISSAQATA